MPLTLSASYKVEGMIGCDAEKDLEILAVVEHEPCDTGSGFGERDIVWYFDNLEKAKKAQTQLDLIDGVETSLS